MAATLNRRAAAALPCSIEPLQARRVRSSQNLKNSA
jgi:hypothetical protein